MSIVSEYPAANAWRNNGDAEGFKLARAYRYHRARLAHFEGRPPHALASDKRMRYRAPIGATAALALAKADIAAGLARYPVTDASKPGAPGERGGRWIESPEAAGFRFVGFSDECGGRSFRRVDHNGWYCDSSGDGMLARGAVYQMPSRGGRSVYVEALRTGELRKGDAWGDMGEHGSACLFLASLHYGEPGGRDCDTEPAMLDAASGADREAELYAEREREYQEAFAAGQACAEAETAYKVNRADARRIVRELRDVRRELRGRPFPTLCDALRSAIRTYLESAVAARDKAATLRSDWGGFAGTWRAHLSEAFAEGLGE